MHPDHRTSGRLSFQINPEAKNAGLILLKKLLFTIKTLNFSFFFRTIWVLPCCFQFANPKTLEQNFASFNCSKVSFALGQYYKGTSTPNNVTGRWMPSPGVTFFHAQAFGTHVSISTYTITSLRSIPFCDPAPQTP